MIGDLLTLRAAADPDAIALVVDGVGELSFGEWDRRSNAMARGLADRGINAGDRVFLLFDHARWHEYAIAWAAVQKAAAVAAPFSPRPVGVQLARVLACADVAGIVSPADLAPPEHPGWLAQPAQLEAGHDDGPFSAEWIADHPSEVLYASRALGQPDAVAFAPDDDLFEILGLDTPMAFLHAFSVGSRCGQAALRLPLRLPASVTIVLPSFSSERLFRLVEDQGIGAVGLPAFLAHALTSSPWAKVNDRSSVRHVVVSGRLSGSLRARIGEAFPAAVIRAVDGATEPDPPRGESPSGTSSPHEEIYDIIGWVWRRVLRVDHVGSHDDFFRLGGTSLAATEMLSLVRDAFDVDIEPATFFSSPTPQALAATVAHHLEEGGPCRSAPPLAFSQEAFVWHEQLAPGCMNLPPVARRLVGPLDVGALASALTDIARRHDPLRTSFDVRERRAIQRVSPPAPVELPVLDLAEQSVEQQQAEVARAMREATTRPFDLVSGPVFRPRLLRLGVEEHVLLVPVHHTMWDDWSEVVFKRELSVLYAAFLAGDRSPLPEPVPSFSEVARDQRRRLAGKVGWAQSTYWRKELAGAPLVVQLPVDDPERPPGTPQAPAGPITLLLPPGLTEQLRALARRNHVTMFMTLMAGFSALVSRYTGQDDVLVASAVANRDSPELEGMIGGFAKKVLVRTRLDDEPNFSQLLKRTRTALLGALSNQDLPYETVLHEALGSQAAEHGLTPYVGVLFQSLAPPRARLALEGMESGRMDPRATRADRVHFAAARDIATSETADATTWGSGLYLGTFVRVMVMETKKGLTCEAWGAFHPPAVERLLASFQTLLERIVAHPDQPVSQLAAAALTGDAGIAAVSSSEAAPVPCCGPDAFAAQVRRHPHDPALIDGGTVLTYAELDARSDQLAHRLEALGVVRRQVVGVSLKASVDLVVAVLGIWKAGVAFVGIDAGDPARLAAIRSDLGVDTVVTHAGRGRELDGHGCQVVLLGEVTSGAEPPPPPGCEGPNALACVFAGSAAPPEPAGWAMIEHRSLANLAVGLQQHLYPDESEPGTRVLLSAGPAEAAFLRQLSAVLVGQTVVIASGQDAEAPTVLSLLRDARVDVVHCGSDELQALTASGLNGSLASRPAEAPAPQLVVSWSGPLTQVAWDASGDIDGARVHHLYGPVECGFGATMGLVSKGARPSIGRPMPNVRAYVRDPRDRAVPEGAVGRLHIAGLGLARGALPGRLPDEPVWDTGHLARRRHDGAFELLGRQSDYVNLRGVLVQRSRLENALCACPGVKDSAVVTHDDGLVAYVVPEAERLPDLSELRTELWVTIPGYAWPREVVIVATIPRLASGEPDPAALIEGERADPQSVLSGCEESELLAAAWAQILDIDDVALAANYWQSFPFLDAVDLACHAAAQVTAQQVANNRTVETLGTAIAADRIRRGRRYEPGPATA